MTGERWSEIWCRLALLLAVCLMLAGCGRIQPETEEAATGISQEESDKKGAVPGPLSTEEGSESLILSESGQRDSSSAAETELIECGIIIDDIVWDAWTAETDLYHHYYEMADEEQRRQLEEFDKTEKDKATMHYQRKMLIILGVLPEDSPRLTAKQAKAICDEVAATMSFENQTGYMLEICRRFNEICGAADLFWNTPMCYYFLDEEGTQKILVAYGNVGIVKGEKLSSYAP